MTTTNRLEIPMLFEHVLSRELVVPSLANTVRPRLSTLALDAFAQGEVFGAADNSEISIHKPDWLGRLTVTIIYERPRLYDPSKANTSGETQPQLVTLGLSSPSAGTLELTSRPSANDTTSTLIVANSEGVVSETLDQRFGLHDVQDAVTAVATSYLDNHLSAR